MKHLLTILIVALATACSGPTNAVEPEMLTGYWEIESASIDGAPTMEYGLNPAIEYFFVEPGGMSGYRKKVQPLINGRFLTSDDALRFHIEQADGEYWLRYKEGELSWNERIIALDSVHLELQGEREAVFRYRRHSPMLPVFDPPR